MFQKYPENFTYFLTVSIVFLRLNNFKTRTDMNAKMSVFVICVEAIIYLLLYICYYYTFVTCMTLPLRKKLSRSSISFF